MSCNADYTGASGGQCLPVLVGTDPSDVCDELLTCDGLGACMPPWVGIKQFGSAQWEEARAVAVDGDGNVFVAGFTGGTLDGNVSAGGDDAFLVKLSVSGVRLWARQIGTASKDAATGVAVDVSGNVYVGGYTSGHLAGRTNAGAADIFLLKYDTNGNLVWARLAGSSSSDSGGYVAVDAQGYVYVAGFTSGDLGGVVVGSNDVVLLKYAPDGTQLFVRKRGTTTADVARGVAVAGSSVFLSGYTSGTLDGQANAGLKDVFVMKFDLNGSHSWTRLFGTMLDDESYGITVDRFGSAYAVGSCVVEVDWEGQPWTDGLVVKYSTTGLLQWTRYMSTVADEMALAVAVGPDDGVTVTGRTDGALDGNTSSGGGDVFVTKYDEQGSRLWTAQVGSTSGSPSDAGRAAAFDTAGNTVVAGETYGALDGSTTLGGSDIFVLKLGLGGTLR